jgi:hypothetical protein
MLTKSQVFEKHTNPGQLFLASSFPLIVKNPDIFSLDCISPEGLLLPSDSHEVKTLIIKFKNHFGAFQTNGNQLESFIHQIEKCEVNPDESESNCVIQIRKMNHKPQKASGGVEASVDTRRINFMKDETTPNAESEAVVDFGNVQSCNIKNNPYKILIGGGFLIDKKSFSFKDTGEKGSDESESESEDSEDEIVEFEEKNQINNKFLEESKDSLTMEFESLLVTKKNLKIKEEKYNDELQKQKEDLNNQIGGVYERKFQITYMGNKESLKSGLMSMKELVEFFKTIKNRSCFLITNIWKNRVYQFYYFISEILPLMQAKVLTTVHQTSPDQMFLNVKKPNSQNKQNFKKSNENQIKKTGDSHKNFQNASESHQSPQIVSFSRKSGEQILKTNNLSMNKNLSSISPSHVSNGSMNGNSFFNLKGEGLLKQRANSQKKKNLSSESFSNQNEYEKKLQIKSKQSIIYEYGLSSSSKEFLMPKEFQKNKLSSSENNTKSKLNLLDMLDGKNEIKQEKSRVTDKKTENKKKKKSSIKSRLKEKKNKKKKLKKNKKSLKLIQEFHPTKIKNSKQANFQTFPHPPNFQNYLNKNPYNINPVYYPPVQPIQNSKYFKTLNKSSTSTHQSLPTKHPIQPPLALGPIIIIFQFRGDETGPKSEHNPKREFAEHPCPKHLLDPGKPRNFIQRETIFVQSKCF